MRRRKNAKTRMRDGLIDAFGSSIIKKLRNRHMLLCPFPLDPMVLYRSLWNDAQFEGLKALFMVDGLLTRRSQMHLRVPLVPDDDGENNEVHIIVNLPEPQPMGGGDYDEIDYTKFTDEELAMVRSWVVDWRKFQDDTDRVEVAVNDVVKACNSIGQVIRIWPDLLGFMKPSQQDEVKNKATRSPYPKDALEWYHNGQGQVCHRLAPGFQPERFKALHDVIAESLMLPEYDDLKHIAHHSWAPKEKKPF